MNVSTSVTTCLYNSSVQISSICLNASASASAISTARICPCTCATHPLCSCASASAGTIAGANTIDGAVASTLSILAPIPVPVISEVLS